MLLVLLVPFAFVAACNKVPLMAPTGSVITLIPASLTVANNSQVQIIATVIEHGTASGGSSPTTTTTTTGGGIPVQNGTVVSFTTTLGHIEPAEARTHNGQVTVTLFTDSNSGNPTITAYSGGASATNKDIKIGTATVKTVNVVASPATLGASGGNSLITASVLNDQGGPVPGVPVTFSTDKGTVSPAIMTTDASGNATTTLSTTATAKVNATAGSVTTANPATVTVNGRLLGSFTASKGAESVGVPLTFTVVLNSTGLNSTINNVHIDFGDGASTDLGAIIQQSNATHAYCSTGTYNATATAIDSTGDRQTVGTTILIGTLGVTLTSTPSGTTTVGTPVTFAVNGVSTALVGRYTWTFDDGTPSFDTSAPQATQTFASRGQKTVRVGVTGVGCGTIGTATLQIVVQ